MNLTRYARTFIVPNQIFISIIEIYNFLNSEIIRNSRESLESNFDKAWILQLHFFKKNQF